MSNKIEDVQDNLLSNAIKESKVSNAKELLESTLTEEDISFKLLDDLEELQEPKSILEIGGMDKIQLIDYIQKLQNIIWHQ